MSQVQHPVILFDGVCNLCNKSAQFIIKRDKNKKFRFAALQSAYAAKHLAGKNIVGLDSVVLLQNDKVYTQSNAALRIAAQLEGAWPLLYVFIILPRFLRDGVYKFIAKNRYKWFGKQESCMLPRPELKDLFLG